MEIIILLVGFIVVMLYLVNLEKKTTKIGELLLMSEQERKDFLESINQTTKRDIDKLVK